MINIHKTIINLFNNELLEKKRSLAILQSYKSKTTDSTDDVKLNNLIDEITREIKSECGKNKYILETFLILNEYVTLLKCPMGSSNSQELLNRKTALTKEFNCIVNTLTREKNWTTISALENNHTSSSNNIACNFCSSTWIEIDEIGRKICMDCCRENVTLESGNTHLDYSRATIVGKFIYNRTLHFEDCIKQFQGKQNCKIPQIIYDELDKKFKAYKLLIDSPNPIIKYSRITKQHIQTFLKELRFVKHYENINIIFTSLTNNKIDDISYLEPQLIEDFKELVTLYDSLHSKDKSEELDRKNFLNVQYILFQLLRRHGYKCKIDDFSTLKTTDRKLFHDKICCNLFQQLGWNFTPTF